MNKIYAIFKYPYPKRFNNPVGGNLKIFEYPDNLSYGRMTTLGLIPLIQMDISMRFL